VTGTPETVPGSALDEPTGSSSALLLGPKRAISPSADGQGVRAGEGEADVTRTIRIAAIGECMIELRHLSGATLELAFGGDTFNTAAYLARVGGDRIAVDYATALGDDPYSDAMREAIAAEGVGTDRIARLAGRLPGLYTIRVDARGERSFFYWRRDAAARAMFDDAPGAALAEALTSYDWLYLSGITLSILAGDARERLFGVLADARRRGARVAFDTNFRPRGWPDQEAARAAMTRALGLADLALPTFSDEAALFGDADPQATVARIAALGVPEIAVKNGPDPILLRSGAVAETVDCPPVVRVVDTTAAGDAFNAAYLAARIRGEPPGAAARIGARLAGVVIGHRGAVIDRAAMPSIWR
jgi:2-dehydro-3-deoxygluconokinase